ncbi:AfsR/SARP family transcriptional regulator [Amycolatopsis anabasis]|uniref:AfsR/SARP family transcriptional regulator n=1 Tax=Amycolatopsis anabasis TaxID=1840409 RepID=UPI001FE6C0EF|nr:AfsR/SARP family transcriptional regulator [Amycolatopsis anabasis]
MRLAVLGPLRAWRGEEPLDLGPVRQQALLAALVLRPDVPVSQQELLDSVWGLEPPGTGGKVVPVYVHRLRKCLRADGEDTADSVIGRSRGGYRFTSAGVWLDSMRLEEIVAEAGAAEQSGDLAAAVSAYADALALFEGEPLAGLPGPFVEGERLRLTERRIALAQEKVKRQLVLGRHADAVAELSALTQGHPYSESLAALLMRALYFDGRRADALAVFTQLRRRLVDELGVEPGEELRRVQQAVLRGEDTALGVARPREPKPPPRKARNELPADVGELAGRERELARLTAPDEAAGVTVDAVDGVAGAGKTALAVRAAHLIRERYPDGCLVVDLHGHTEGRSPLSPQRALRRLLRTTRVDDNRIPDDLDELVAVWRSVTAELRLLLVLDDAAGAEQVRPLVPAGPGSKVLVTSRQRLSGLDVNRRISLGVLGSDAAEALLASIVGAPRAGRERDAVRELARLCGRLPLALRIAGARLQNRPTWTFDYLATRLADDERRLGELSVADRSVEAALRLSYDQLPAAEQRAFRVLGRCPSVELDRLALGAMLGCPPEEAEQALESLVDANLLEQPAAGRYRLHDLVAVFARQLSAAAPPEVVAAARTGALRLYVTAARCTSDWGLPGFPTGPELGDNPFTGWADAAAWLDAAGGELVDVVAHAAAIGEVDYACWIAEGLVDYLTRQGRFHECRTALEIALPLVDQATDERMICSLRFCLGFAYGMQTHFDQARTWVADALRLSRQLGYRREEARALGTLGAIATAEGRHSQATGDLVEAMALAAELGDDWLISMGTSYLGYIHHMQGRHEQALDSFAQCQLLGEKIDSPRMTGTALCAYGTVHLHLGRFAEAAAALRRAVELGEQVVDVTLLAGSMARLGIAERELGNVDTALELQRRALAVITDQTPAGVEMEARNRLGDSLLAAGNPAEAREQFELVLALTETNENLGERARAAAGLDRCGPA